MAKAFRPQVVVSIPRSYSGEFSKHICGGYIRKTYGTYAELKKQIKVLLEISDDNEVCVYRHRRGEWGEWFEKWAMINGKPQIFKKGWQ